jgi:hypothetical protein
MSRKRTRGKKAFLWLSGGGTLPLFNRPEWKRLSGSETGILMIGKIKPSMAIRPEMGLIFSEIELIKGAWVLFGPNLNSYQILIT